MEMRVLDESRFDDAELSDMIGAEFVSVKRINPDYQDTIRFACADGRVFLMTHFNLCCESVDIEEIHGELSDLVGGRVVDAYCATGDSEAGQWTFYRISTERATVSIRWWANDNYYSVDVHFVVAKDSLPEQ